MESTGVYWIPLFELLEKQGFQVYLVDPRQTKQVPGRPKTDVLDCQWIQRLHSYGLLAPSFRPEDQVVVLRSYLRQRQMLMSYASSHIQHMQKALEQMNVKLTEVVDDVTGVTGLSIIRAILAGERDPQTLAKLRNQRCRRSEAEIARALYGNWRDEHLFALRQALALYETYKAKADDCDRAIAKHLGQCDDRSGSKKLDPHPRGNRRRKNQPAFPVRDALLRFSGVDLTIIEGIDQSTALMILGEIGHDMSKWPTAKHFASWLGLCPPQDESAGKKKRRPRRRKGIHPAARAFRMAAQGCHHAHNALGISIGASKPVAAGPRLSWPRHTKSLNVSIAYSNMARHMFGRAWKLPRRPIRPNASMV